MMKWIRRFRFMLDIRKSIPFLFEFFRSGQVKTRHKIISVLLLASYFLFPFDLIPDFLGLLGIFDDLTVMTWVLQQIVKIAPPSLKEKYNLKEE